jgi:hypothetical protein
MRSLPNHRLSAEMPISGLKRSGNPAILVRLLSAIKWLNFSVQQSLFANVQACDFPRIAILDHNKPYCTFSIIGIYDTIRYFNSFPIC